MMLVQVCVASLLAEVELGLNGRAKTMEELSYEFDVFYFLCLSYTFEILYLRTFKSGFVHHACVIGATFWFSAKRVTENPQRLVEIAQIPTIMGICSAGILNFGLNGLRLISSGVIPFQARVLRILIMVFSGIAWSGFLIQWIMVSLHFLLSNPLVSLGWLEKFVSFSVLVFWARDELNAAVCLKRMAYDSVDVSENS
jgi:hypothetical protein